MKRNFLLCLMIGFLVFGAIGMAQATLLGTTGRGGTISTLVEINETTGAIISTIGSVGYTVNGLTYDAVTGKLYGSTSVHGAFNGLIEIDMTTGAGTMIGVHGWGLGDFYGPGGDAAAVTNITVDSAGSMFGWWDPSQDDLVSIDKTTGIATRVGESGLSTGLNGLAFDNSDTLYMVNYDGNAYSVNPATGSTTLVHNFGITSHHGDFNPADNLYYGLSATSGNILLSVLDLTPGAFASFTIDTDDNLHTLAFVGAQIPIPEPTTLLLIGFGLVGAAGVTRRKQRK